MLVWLSVMLSTFVSSTLTAHFAITPEASAAVAVMVALPTAMAVTFPLESMVATSLLSTVHMTSLFVAFCGDTVAVILTVSPALISMLVWFKTILSICVILLIKVVASGNSVSLFDASENIIFFRQISPPLKLSFALTRKLNNGPLSFAKGVLSSEKQIIFTLFPSVKLILMEWLLEARSERTTYSWFCSSISTLSGNVISTWNAV